VEVLTDLLCSPISNHIVAGKASLSFLQLGKFTILALNRLDLALGLFSTDLVFKHVDLVRILLVLDKSLVPILGEILDKLGSLGVHLNLIGTLLVAALLPAANITRPNSGVEGSITTLCTLLLNGLAI